MSLPFPLHFTIEGADWKVRMRKRVLDDAGNECRGLTDPIKRVIYLDNTLPAKEMIWIFWHEYMHAVLHEASVTGNDGGLDGIVEEIICDKFANAMTRDKTVTWKRKKPASK